MLTPDYFYTIVGGGLAGLQLAYSFSNDIFFRGKKIAIIEPFLKDVNDKTWCFWEKEPGKWDLLKHHSWNSAKMFAQGNELDLKLAPYQYKMIRSIDFYNFLKDELAKNEHIYFVKDHIEKIDLVTRTAIGKKRITLRPIFLTAGLRQTIKIQIIHFYSSILEENSSNLKPMFSILPRLRSWTIG